MAIHNEYSAHARFQLLELSFTSNGGEEVVTACSDDSGILQIALTLSQTFSTHANVELALPFIVEDTPQIV